MLPGPVFFHELRAAARRRRTFVLRTGIGLALLYLLISIVGEGPFGGTSAREFSHGELAQLGGGLFFATVWAEFLLILALTPAYLAGAIAEDRQRKILPYLLASPLSGAEIVLGKFAARLVNLVTLLLMGLPILSLSLFLGGVDPAMVWLTAGVELSMLCSLAGLSMVVSLYCSWPRDAIVATYSIELAGLWLLMVLDSLRSGGGLLASWLQGLDPLCDWLVALSPLSWMFAAPSHGFLWPRALLQQSLLSHLAVSIPLLAWATLRLRPRERGPRIGRFRRFLGLNGRRDGPIRLFPRRPVGDRPMIWKECSGSLGSSSLPRFALATCLKVTLAAGLVVVLVIPGIPAFQDLLDHGYGSTDFHYAVENLNFVIRYVTTVLYILAGLLTCVSAASGFTSERERDTWISLVATPLEGREIILAKILGAYRRTRFLLAGMLVAWTAGLVCGAVHPLGYLLATLLTACLLVFPATLGTYFSLRCKTSAGAISATVGIAAFLNLGYMLCCIPSLRGGPGSEVVLAGISPLFVALAPFSYRELDRLIHGERLVDSGIVMGFLLCVIFYGLCSAGLFGISREEFEILVDRPRRGFRHPLERPNPAGIEFLDESPAPDSVVFLPDDESESSPSIQETTRPDDPRKG